MRNKPFYTKRMQHPKFEHLEVVFEAVCENSDPHDQFDNLDDIDFAMSDNLAAWFMAIVKVELKGTSLFGYDNLGCCSYKSFEDFLSDDGYFPEMIETATADLINDLNDTTDKLNDFVNEYNKAG